MRRTRKTEIVVRLDNTNRRLLRDYNQWTHLMNGNAGLLHHQLTICNDLLPLREAVTSSSQGLGG